MSSGTEKVPVVILAGGFGTRLKTVVGDCPKPMAPVQGKPFLEYLLRSLEQSGIVSKCILSVGYLSNQIKSHFGKNFGSIPVEYSIEDSPLGTGGAVLKAARMMSENEFILMNGDTFFPVDLKSLMAVHHEKKADVSIALKKMYDFNRYGTVICRDGQIIHFEEKKSVPDGLINGGVYVFRRDALVKHDLPDVFSLEKDFLEINTADMRFVGVECDEYFIDIGIPEDYQRAQIEM